MLTYFFILLIRVYQKGISPFLPSACRYYPTCSAYAIRCFEKMPIDRAIWTSARRILRCHPFCEGGVDFPSCSQQEHS